jgi:hypothetical protein
VTRSVQRLPVSNGIHFRKMLTSVLLGGLLLSCAPRPQSLILGKWQADGAMKVTAEFRPNGTARLMILGQTVQGAYKLNGADELEWTMNGRTTRAKIALSATKLELTSADNQTIVYRRQP